jgi:hypothetical protein
MSSQFFMHRPPSTGIHLLNDPLPERVESPAALRGGSEHVVPKKRARPRAKAKKSGLDS